jgi:BirA family biotin operon repressor/biotin-[acetyl-CoA-carboxylase] ligase
MKIVYISETDSTNSWLSEHGGEDDVAVWTGYQTAGRGAGTNRWESEAHKNLLFSVLVHPVGVPASRQFLLTEAMALSVKRTFDGYGLVPQLSIKWPNDIYWRDSKLAGTLSTCTLKGSHIRSCIIGTGVNINQQVFGSDLPNPVSLMQITGREHDVEQGLKGVLAVFGNYLNLMEQGGWDDIHAAYCSALYRRQGFYRYCDGEGDFMAAIEGVEPDGRLLLRDDKGNVRRYGFKELMIKD